MSCSRALRVEPIGVLVRDRHGELVEQLLDGREHRRRVRELRKHDQPHRQERRAAGDGGSRSSRACGRCCRASARGRAGFGDRSGTRRRRSAASVGARAVTRRRCDPVERHRATPRRACCSASRYPRCSGVSRIVLRRADRDTASCVERQRPDVVRTGRVEVHLLAEAVGIEQERARPAGARAAAAPPRRTTARSRRPGRAIDEQVVGRADRAAARRLRACSGRASASTAMRRTRAA